MFANDLYLAAPRLFAFLQGATPVETTEEPSFLNSLLFPLLLMGVLFYVIMLGPERKQRKKREEMLAAMKKGDHVLTTSGIYGTVAVVTDDVITLQVADGVRMKFTRSSVQTSLEEQAEGKKESAKAEPAKGS